MKNAEMPKFAIQTHELNFGYGRDLLLQNLQVEVPRGSIYGLLGRNGAGKTTLMQLLLGLLRPRRGSIQLLGNPLDTRRPEIFSDIGSLISRPHLYPHLTARQQLQVHCTYRGLPFSRIPEVLQLVQLQHAAGQRVSQYSTGMRRRLALAQALLPQPRLLLLDEPTNGLDPEGIAGIRRLLLSINREAGITILLSSHLLGEVEQTCSHLGILQGGNLRFQGSLQELQARRGGLKVVVEVESGEAALRFLNSHGFALEQMDDHSLLVELANRDAIPELIDLLRGEGFSIYRVEPRQARLEDLFLQLSKDTP